MAKLSKEEIQANREQFKKDPGEYIANLFKKEHAELGTGRMIFKFIANILIVMLIAGALIHTDRVITTCEIYTESETIFKGNRINTIQKWNSLIQEYEGMGRPQPLLAQPTTSEIGLPKPFQYNLKCNYIIKNIIPNIKNEYNRLLN